MARKTKSKPDQSTSVSFVALKKVGDTAEGTFNGYLATIYGLAARLKQGKKEVAVGLQNKGLQGIFKANLDAIQNGVKIKVVFTGLGKKKVKGNYPKKFDVFINGTQVFGGGFQNATDKQIKTFFA